MKFIQKLLLIFLASNTTYSSNMPELFASIEIIPECSLGYCDSTLEIEEGFQQNGLFKRSSLYAIVGGPASGKTSVINALSASGNAVVAEAASDYIAKRLEEGAPEPWFEKDFEWNVVHMQIDREQAALLNPSIKGPVYTDRGVLDCYAYFHLRKREEEPEYKRVDQFLRALDLASHYRAIFFVLPYHEAGHITEITAIRHEDARESEQLAELTHAIYSQRIGRVIAVPGGMTPHERAAFIQNKVAELEQTL